MLKLTLAAALFAAPSAFAVDPVFDGGARVANAPLSEIPVAPATAAPVALSTGNVILLMFDGVRWQEFLDNKPDSFLIKKDTDATFPGFWANLAKRGVVYDDMTVSNPVAISMPGYQSIFTGATQPCKDNDCGRVTVETFPERLLRETGLPKEKVATFSSWTGIALAVEHVQGATFVDAGAAGQTRADADTFAKGLAHLKAEKPRFLYISLDESDNRGHAGDYAGYLAALRRFDVWMADLVATLDGMGEYGRNTTLLVTTDHGRGIYWDWKSHGHRPWARRVWMYALNPKTPRKGIKVSGHEHIDIRPTIETLLGLPPRGSGKPFAEVIP